MNIIIYHDGKVIEKHFNSKKYVKIVYQYDDCGVLIRRWWYDKSGNLLGISFDE